jgi:hypothetical protein
VPHHELQPTGGWPDFDRCDVLGGRTDRVTLFVNRQGDTSGPNPPEEGSEGMTFAILGPWRRGAL